MGLFTSNSTFASVVMSLISLINLTVGVLSAGALVIFFVGLVRYVRHADDAHSLQEGRKTIIWSLVALFVLFSLYGILQVMNIAFFGGTLSSGGSYYSAPPTMDQSGLPAIR